MGGGSNQRSDAEPKMPQAIAACPRAPMGDPDTGNLILSL